MERFEIVIVGGGVIGCAIARELARSGARVCLLERGRIGGESSGAAAGMLGVQSENEDELLLQLGAESRRMYPSTLAALETETAVSVEFWRQGTLYCCFTEDDEVRLEDRRRRQQATGLDSRWLTNRQTRAREPALSARIRAAVLFEQDGRVANGALTAAYAEAARAAGGTVREAVLVRRVVVEGGRVAGLETDNGPLGCDVLVNAAGAWAATLGVGIPLPVTPVRGQIVAVRSERPLFRHAIYSAHGYAVTRRDGSVLLGSTREAAGFEKRITVGGVQQIVQSALELSPAIGALAFREAWAGLRPATPDGLPIVGRDPSVEGYYVATGHYRNGILLAPITAAMIAALLRGEQPRWAERLRPDRFAA